MQTELTRLEQSAMPDEKTNTKRPREEEPDERLGLLSRKNRKLQEGRIQFPQKQSPKQTI